MSNVTCDENCAECGRWTTMHSNGEYVSYDCLVTGKYIVKRKGKGTMRMTNADRIRNMSDEELADYLATVTSDVICGSSWDYDEWIKELQSEAK